MTGARWLWPWYFQWFCYVLNGSAISLTVNRPSDHRAGFRRFAGFARVARLFPRLDDAFISCPGPVNKRPEEAFASNTARAALIIPAHFGRDMARGIDDRSSCW